MNADPSHRKPAPGDEVDLGQFFQLINRGFKQIFLGLLSVFLFVKRNVLWLGGLIVVGVVLGILLKFIVVEEHKLDVIVTPMVDNTQYLNSVVSEIQANIKAQDTSFFLSLGMDISKMKSFDVELTPLRTTVAESRPEDKDFMELLIEFGQSEAAEEIIRSELLERITQDHLITFYFKNVDIGEQYAKRLLEYINSNAFYKELNTVSRENAEERIHRNDSLLAQIDILIENYTARMKEEVKTQAGSLVLDNQEALDVPSLFELKNQLIRDSEDKRLELIRREEAIRILNFGKPHQVEKPLFGNWMVLLPLVLVGLFLLIAFLKYLDKQADEMLHENQ